jgi:hypothetical protein
VSLSNSPTSPILTRPSISLPLIHNLTITGTQFENSADIGVFSKLTNAYCLTAVASSSNFYSVFEAELGDVIPIIHTTIAGTRIVGRLTAGECCMRIGLMGWGGGKEEASDELKVG